MTTRTTTTFGVALVTAVALFAPRDAAAQSSPGKLKFCTDIAFTRCSTQLKPGTEIYVRAEFPKAVGEIFKDGFQMDRIPSSGKFVLAIARNVDDENPIIMHPGPIFPSRYDNQGTFDLTLQASLEAVDKIAKGGPAIEKVLPFNSIQNMGVPGLSMAWNRATLTMPTGSGEWEAFLIFLHANDEGDPYFAASGKFTYTITAADRNTIVGEMNEVERVNFEKRPDDGVTTGLHKANLGKLVFAAQKLDKTFDDPGAVVTSSTLAKGLYANLYLDQSIRNKLSELGKGSGGGNLEVRLTFEIGGKSRAVDTVIAAEQIDTATTHSFVLVPGNEAEGKLRPEVTEKLAYLLSTLGDGTHTLKVKAATSEIGGVVDMDLGSGEVQLKVKKKQRDAVVKKYGEKLPGKGLLADKKLLAEVRTLAGKKYRSLRIPASWQIFKNADDEIAFRTVTLFATVVDGDGGCKLTAAVLEQTLFGDRWSEVYFKQPFGSERDFPCQNADKK